MVSKYVKVIVLGLALEVWRLEDWIVSNYTIYMVSSAQLVYCQAQPKLGLALVSIFTHPPPGLVVKLDN